MIQKVTHLTLLVQDQDRALQFYTQQFGFMVHTDTTDPSMPGFRWLTIHLPAHPELEVSLMAAGTAEQKDTVGKQTPGIPVLSMSTSDCHATYAHLKNNGVVILQEPTQRPWGTELVCLDPDGNMIHINQAG